MSETLGNILRSAEKILDYLQWCRDYPGGEPECPWCHSHNGYHKGGCELQATLDDIIKFNKAIKTDAPDIVKDTKTKALEWAVKWIEDSVGESAAPEVREFAHNMAMSIRARIFQGW